MRVVPGDHLSMIAEPFVWHLAKALSDELDVVQAVPPKRARVLRAIKIGSKKEATKAFTR